MCGIVGILSKKRNRFNFSDLDVFRDMLITDSIRGEDSTGVFTVRDSGNADWLKLATHPYNLVRSKEYEEWKNTAHGKGRVIVGHNRKATFGGINNKNAHPFIFGNTVLIHNGGLDNFRSLLSHREREKWGVEVDSHAAAILLARNDPEKILKEMKGAFTFVWYDVEKKQLYFVRNEERPLYFANTDTKIYFASEAGMLTWILGRRGIANKVINLKPGVLITMFLDGDDLSWEHKIIPFEIPKVYVPASSQTSTPPSRLTALAKFAQRNIQCTDRTKLREEDRYNIHYGGNTFVEPDEVVYQQLVFSADDFKQVEPQNDPRNASTNWVLWGQALDSDRINVICNVQGTEKDIEALGYASHLIGFVKRVKEQKVGHDQHIEQEVIVTDVIPVDMTSTKNGQAITSEHLKYLQKNGLCECGGNCSDFLVDDYNITSTGPKVKIMCTWCEQSGGALAQDTANPTI